MRRIGKRATWPAAASLLTGLLLCVVFFAFGLFPFGENTLSWGDMNQQVVPLMLEFKDILAGKSGFLFNVQNAGGMSFWGVFFFFLSSPFTFLVAFMEKTWIYRLMNLLVLFKISLCAGSASVFFQTEYRQKNLGVHLFLCLSYAFCGYGLLYYQNIVWLDVLCMFPILALGFRNLVFEGKPCLFTISLMIMVVLNYYLSYMVFLALILMAALFLKNCVPKESWPRIAGSLGASALFSLLVTSLVWMPSLLQCLRSARTSQGLISTIQGGGFFTELSTTLPMLLCTGGCLCLSVLVSWFPGSPKRKTLLQLFFLTSVPLVLEPVNKLWHTGSYQAFPARYGYIPVFLALWFLSDVLNEKDFQKQTVHAKRRWDLFLIPALLALWALGVLYWNFENIISYVRTLWIDNESFLFLLLFSILSALGTLWGLHRAKQGKIDQKALGGFLLSLCVIQGIYHSAVLIGPSAHVPRREVEILKSESRISAPGFYRVKQDFKFCDVNLLGAAGYATLNHYTSLTDESFLHAMKKLGYSSYWMETSACCGTVLSDILLSNKYVLTEDLQFQRTESGNLGYLLPAGVLPETLEEQNRFELQNELFQKITGEKEDNAFQIHPISKRLGVTIGKSEDGTLLEKTDSAASLCYEIEVEERETLYFDAFCENTNRLREAVNNSFQIRVNGETLTEGYPSQGCNGILKLGEFERQKVLVEVQVKKTVNGLKSLGVYGLKSEKANTFTESLAHSELSVKKSKVYGTATASSGQSLFLSIPYEPGMQAFVNGKPVKIRKVLDCFLEIPLETGENRLELTSLPEGVKPAMLLTALGLALLSLWIFLHRKPSVGKRLSSLWGRAAVPLLYATYGAVLLAVYFLPLFIWMWQFI